MHVLWYIGCQATLHGLLRKRTQETKKIKVCQVTFYPCPHPKPLVRRVSILACGVVPNFNSISSGVSEPQVPENRHIPLTRGIALTIACHFSISLIRML